MKHCFMCENCLNCHRNTVLSRALVTNAEKEMLYMKFDFEFNRAQHATSDLCDGDTSLYLRKQTSEHVLLGCTVGLSFSLASLYINVTKTEINMGKTHMTIAASAIGKLGISHQKSVGCESGFFSNDSKECEDELTACTNIVSRYCRKKANTKTELHRRSALLRL